MVPMFEVPVQSVELVRLHCSTFWHEDIFLYIYFILENVGTTHEAQMIFTAKVFFIVDCSSFLHSAH